MKIDIKLNKNRLIPGTLTIGTFSCPCLGRADNFLATKHSNPTKDPAKAFGNTPLGSFKGTVVAAGPSLRSYGPNKRILLIEDLEAREGLMIHGGAPGNGGGLRPTEGCVRVSNDNMVQILDLVDKQPIEVEITENA